MNKIKCSVESLLGTTTGLHSQGREHDADRRQQLKNVTCLLSNLIALFSLFAFANLNFFGEFFSKYDIRY